MFRFGRDFFSRFYNIVRRRRFGRFLHRFERMRRMGGRTGRTRIKRERRERFSTTRSKRSSMRRVVVVRRKGAEEVKKSGILRITSELKTRVVDMNTRVEKEFDERKMGSTDGKMKRRLGTSRVGKQEMGIVELFESAAQAKEMLKHSRPAVLSNPMHDGIVVGVDGKDARK